MADATGVVFSLRELSPGSKITALATTTSRVLLGGTFNGDMTVDLQTFKSRGLGDLFAGRWRLVQGDRPVRIEQLVLAGPLTRKVASPTVDPLVHAGAFLADLVGAGGVGVPPDQRRIIDALVVDDPAPVPLVAIR